MAPSIYESLSLILREGKLLTLRKMVKLNPTHLRRCALGVILLLLVQSTLLSNMLTPTKTSNSSSEVTASAAASAPITVFYNIYLDPKKENRQQYGLQVVREQVEMIRHSYAAKVSASRWRKLKVLYTTIGAPNVLTPKLMKDMCKGVGGNKTESYHITCEPLEHVATGSEKVTLGHLYNYCTAQEYHANPNRQAFLADNRKHERVVYIHSKGSFHYSPTNENWRRALTEAPLSEHCLGPTATVYGQSCNTCGLNFYTQWTNFYPGNMFTATCDYVSKLLPPHDFERHTERAAKTAMLLRVTEQVKFDLFPAFGRDQQLANFGLGRYTDEHWIGSHPDIRPCDCDPSGSVALYQRTARTLQDLSFAKAPRHRGPPFWGMMIFTTTLERHASEGDRLRQYVYLVGQLIKWFTLYGRSPPPDSWAWTWFPDGELWRDNVAKYGAKAIDVVTRPFATKLFIDDGGEGSTFSSIRTLSESESAPTRTEEKQVWSFSQPSVLAKNSSSVAIFYDAILPEIDTKEQAKKGGDLIKEQFRLITEKAGQLESAEVFFSTHGYSGMEFMNPCGDALNFPCHRSWHKHHHHHPENRSGFVQQIRTNTFEHVHSYCQKYPKNRVVYLNNQPPEISEARKHKSEERKMLIMHLTKAALDDKCLNAVKGSDTDSGSPSCSICGLYFSTIPKLMMAGNSWAAHCSYINKLMLPDQKFVNKIRDIVEDALLLNIKGQMKFDILRERMDRFGFGGYAPEHWIGSHPSLVPCDLSQNKDMNYWLSTFASASDYSLSAPGGSPKRTWMAECNEACQKRLELDEFRFIEYYYLAGNLLKWYTLYGAAPPASSWVWTLFPDGSMWLESVKVHGSQAVQVVTSSFLSQSSTLNITTSTQ